MEQQNYQKLLTSAYICGMIDIYTVRDDITEKENVFAWVSLLILAN